MKRIVFTALLALALPVAAFAGNVDIANAGGTLSGSDAGLTLSGSEITQVGSIQGNLGSLSFTTGTFNLGSGSLQAGGYFNSGGSFTITTNGTGGLPNGTLFSGTFTGLTYWTAEPGCDGRHSVCYNLSGTVSGTWYNGRTVSGVNTEITMNAGKNGFMGSVPVFSGDTGISTVPEPSTLGLLGTGLVGLAGAIRRKLKI